MNKYYLICLISVTIASFSQILLKKGALKNYSTWIREYVNIYVITGYILMFGSVFLTIIAYGGMDNFLIVPVLEALGYILVPLLSYIYFGETFTKKKVMGIACIMLGILVYNL